jgi:hypothetical protein
LEEKSKSEKLKQRHSKGLFIEQTRDSVYSDVIPVGTKTDMKFKQKVNNEGSEGASSSYPQGANLSGNIFKSGRWTRSEHLRFLQALKIYGKEWRKVQSHVKTRNST